MRQTQSNKCANITDTANKIIFGLGQGAFYGWTSLAGMMSLIENRPLSITAGVLAGLAGGITNASQAPQATRVIFTKRPDIWLMLPVVFLTIGGLAALPFVAAVLQATQVIGDKIGVSNLTSINPVMGNTIFITTGIMFSIGFVNFLGNLWALMQWKLCHNEKYKYSLMQNYINDYRSENELLAFTANPDSFFHDKWSKKNILCAILSMLPAFIVMFTVAGEIPNALNSKNQIATMRALNVFGLIPIDEFAKTTLGSKIIALSTGVPLFSIFAGTSTRTLQRDLKFLWNALYHHQYANALKILVYTAFVLSTCFTGLFQAKKAGNNNLVIAATFVCAFWVNYAAARDLFFNTLLPKQNLTLTSSISLPAIAEKAALPAAKEKLEEIRKQFEESQVQDNEGSSAKWFPTWFHRKPTTADDARMRLLEEENYRTAYGEIR